MTNYNIILTNHINGKQEYIPVAYKNNFEAAQDYIVCAESYIAWLYDNGDQTFSCKREVNIHLYPEDSTQTIASMFTGGEEFDNFPF